MTPFRVPVFTSYCVTANFAAPDRMANEYAPTAKNATYPKSRSPAKPTTTFRPRASRAAMPIFVRMLVQYSDRAVKYGRKPGNAYARTMTAAMMLQRAIEGSPSYHRRTPLNASRTGSVASR